MKLKVGDPAPDFTISDQSGKPFSLHNLKGGWVLLYFYPKDFTSGCTREVCNMRDNFEELKKLVTIVGISADTVGSHEKFALAYRVPFRLLADPQRAAIKAYGADGFIFARRCSFLINPQGNFVKIYDKVNPDTHAAEILADARTLTR